MRKEVLVWHQGALGDLILSLPAIHSIRSVHSDKRLHLAARTDLAQIVLLNGLADEVSSNEKGLYAGLFSDHNLSGPLLSFLERFSDAFIFLKRTDPVLTENLGKAVPALHQIRTRPPEGVKIHVTEFQLNEIRSAGLEVATRFPMLNAGPVGIDNPRSEKVVSVHPGSGSEKKSWPLGSYLELARILNRSGAFRFFFILGPSESEKHKELHEFISAKKINAEIIIGRTIPFIAGLLKNSSMYVGNDSGITHLASAVGVRVLALFGPTDPALWGPAWGKGRIIRSPLSCSPCCDAYRDCTDATCMKAIDIEMVASEIGNILGVDRVQFR